MKLSDCYIGQIVRERPCDGMGTDTARRTGRITGLTANPMGEVILLVRFACEKQDTGIHHANVEPIDPRY